MVTGIIGKKVGMTQLFLEDGTLEPATVLQAGPCIVVQSKTAQTDGYEAVQLGLVEKNPPRRATKASTGHHKKANVPPTRVQREVRVAKGAEAPKPGDQVLVSIFNQGERVDVIGTSKGHGYQGVVKRHHFRGGDATHGSIIHRASGTIGLYTYPARVMPGMRAHCHMVVDRVTLRNRKVLRLDSEHYLILVKGTIPGANRRYLVIRHAIAPKPE